MRRNLGLGLFGLGVLLLVLAPVIRFAVAPQLVRAPLDVDVTLPHGGTDFRYLSATEGREVVLPHVSVTRHIQGDVKSGNHDVAVYEQGLCLTRDDKDQKLGCLENDPRTIVNFYTRFAFDRVTGLAVSGAKCGSSGKENCQQAEDGDTVVHQGLGFTFPQLTEKKTYLYWDNVARKAYPMQYVDQEKKEGLTVYKFRQVITDAPAMTSGVFPSLYSNTRTLWIEPTTGAIIHGQEEINQRLTGRASNDPGAAMRDPSLAGLTALQGTLAFTPEADRIQAKIARDGIASINLIRVYLPLGSLVLGVILVAVGLVLTLARGGQPRPSGRVRAASPAAA
ncbi:MAG TPA: DUF3068 domain-containing protein [Dermatophilaceae bacterium]|nr:DUF3068 domain-containing protein [Dermatophilaceae bacterium]